MTEFLYPLLLIKLAFRFGAKIKYGLLVNLIDFWNSVKKKNRREIQKKQA